LLCVWHTADATRDRPLCRCWHAAPPEHQPRRPRSRVRVRLQRSTSNTGTSSRESTVFTRHSATSRIRSARQGKSGQTWPLG